MFFFLATHTHAGQTHAGLFTWTLVFTAKPVPALLAGQRGWRGGGGVRSEGLVFDKADSHTRTLKEKVNSWTLEDFLFSNVCVSVFSPSVWTRWWISLLALLEVPLLWCSPNLQMLNFKHVKVFVFAYLSYEMRLWLTSTNSLCVILRNFMWDMTVSKRIDGFKISVCVCVLIAWMCDHNSLFLWSKVFKETWLTSGSCWSFMSAGTGNLETTMQGHLDTENTDMNMTNVIPDGASVTSAALIAAVSSFVCILLHVDCTWSADFPNEGALFAGARLCCNQPQGV